MYVTMDDYRRQADDQDQEIEELRGAITLLQQALDQARWALGHMLDGEREHDIPNATGVNAETAHLIYRVGQEAIRSGAYMYDSGRPKDKNDIR